MSADSSDTDVPERPTTPKQQLRFRAGARPSRPSQDYATGDVDDRKLVRNGGLSPPRTVATELEELRAYCTILESRVNRELVEGTRPFLEEVTPFAFLYEPHTVTALVVTLLVTFYVAFWVPLESTSLASDLQLKLGTMTSAVVFLVYCVVQMRDSILFRPHPAVWRLVHGCSILYLMILVFLLCQTPSNARGVLAWFDGDMVDEARAIRLEYAADCRVFTPEDHGSPIRNVYNIATDIYVLAHLLGWFGKALVLRSWTLCGILMITWELLEYSFQHILQNFTECWWDHWIVDVLICNCGGMVLGMAFGKYWSMKEYNWTGTQMTARGKLKRMVEQFSPYSWTKYSWNIFSHLRRFLSVMLLILVMEVVELNAFFLKHVLWVPPSHWLNSARLTFWFLLSLPGLREYYRYLTDNRQRRLGVNVWMAIALAVTELAIVLKFGVANGLLLQPWPDAVLLCWGSSLALLLVWALLKFDVLPCRTWWGSGPAARVHSFLVNCCFLASLVPLGLLVWTQDVGFGSK